MKIYIQRVFILFFVCTFLQVGYLPKLSAQFRVEDYQKDAVGMGLWYGVGTLSFDAPKDSASNETKGYSDILPSTVEGQGYAIGLSYGSFGMNYGQDRGETTVNKSADIQQNSNPGDDVYVYKVKRINRSLTILFQPFRYLYIGVGQDTGQIEFKQRSTLGINETKKIAYENNFYSWGLAFGFDPTKNTVAPIITIYSKIPQSRSSYYGVVSGMGLGVYF
ncbi:MAG: hypothetical protein GY786_08525 [Proteobacteria bacterium]|nr:hypothetical protein [Pseudomonadota bacterium]